MWFLAAVRASAEHPGPYATVRGALEVLVRGEPQLRPAGTRPPRRSVGSEPVSESPLPPPLPCEISDPRPTEPRMGAASEPMASDPSEPMRVLLSTGTSGELE